MAEKRKAGGRPRKHAVRPGDRVHVGFRVTPQMKARLEKAAAETGRSLSQELELRLENSFSYDFHPPELADAVRNFTNQFHQWAGEYIEHQAPEGENVSGPEVYINGLRGALYYIFEEIPEYPDLRGEARGLVMDILKDLAFKAGLEIKLRPKSMREMARDMVASRLRNMERRKRRLEEELAKWEMYEREAREKLEELDKQEQGNGDS